MKIYKTLFQLILLIHNLNINECFLFSVVMAIYNTGRYLDDSINSILNQTINFEYFIQIILVNDGSTDETEKICLKYQHIYSYNIKLYKNTT